METSRAEHLRKLVTGACLMLAPLVLFVGEVLHPDNRSDAADQVGVVAGGIDRWYAAHLVLLAAFILLVPAVVGLAHLLHRHRPMAAFAGGGSALAGTLAVAALIGADGIAGYYVVREADASTAAAVWDGLMDGAGMVPVYLVTLLFSIGLFVLALGLYRARTVAPWAAMALMAGAVLLFVGFPADMRPMVLVGMVALFVGAAPIGYAVMTESDQEWAETPQFHGFRRAASMGV